MSKYLVETFYTCTFKIVHKLDELNDAKLNELENRTDGSVEIIDVKLNNRKTKTASQKKEILDKTSAKDISKFNALVGEKINFIKNSKESDDSKQIKINEKVYNNKQNINHDRSKMPDRRKGYIQKIIFCCWENHKVWELCKTMFLYYDCKYNDAFDFGGSTK